MLNPTPDVEPNGPASASSLALWTLFEQQETPLLRYAFSLIGRREVAEEIVQDVFLKLHGKFDEIENPQAWLLRSVKNRAFNYIRDHRREVLQTGNHQPADGEPHTTNQETPDARMQRMETLAAVRQMIAELNETDQQLVRLKYFENLKYREIGERTGLTVGNVGYRLHHILKQLAQQLTPLGIDGNA